MKVLFINTVYQTGSTGRIIEDICDALKKMPGNDYLVAYGRGSARDSGHSYRISGRAGVLVHALLSRITDRSGFYSRRATRKLIGVIREFQPDIIHLHNLHGYYLNVEILFSYLKDFPGRVIWTLHDCWAFTGHCTHFAYVNCEKWRTGCRSCAQKGEYPSSRFTDSSKTNYSRKMALFTSVKNMTVIAVSDWLKKAAEESFLGRYPVARVYNGIDPDVFKPTPSPIRIKLGIGDSFMILSVSDGWNDRKGLQDIIRLARSSPSGWRFVIAGLSKRQIRRLPHNIVGLEKIEGARTLVKWYSAADVFLNPSVEESFGLVTVEALACGTPAVVYDRTASPEIIDDKSGIAVPAGNIEKVREQLRALADAQQFSWSDCRKRALLFSKERSISGILDIYGNSVL